MDKSENFFNNMVPKENPDEPVINDNENNGEVIDAADLEGLFDSNSQFCLHFFYFFLEISIVNESIDSLNQALDSVEQRADEIKAELLKLLMSNREIHQTLKEENSQQGKANSDEPME